MPTVTYTNSLPGTTVSAFPLSGSLANWSSLRVAMTEASSPNTGRWTANLAVGSWAIFETATQPANFGLSVGTLVVEDEALGTGARTVTITVTDGSTPIQGATVRLTKSGQTYSGNTNGSGVIVFSVDDGTWTLSVTAAGFTYTPSSVVVDGTETVTAAMSSTGSITPSGAPFTTGYWVVYTEAGVPASGAIVELHVMDPPTGSTGYVLQDTMRVATSDVTGLVSFTNMVPGASYRARLRGSPRMMVVRVPANAGSTVALGSIVG